MNKVGKIIVFIGPSAGGKSSVQKALSSEFKPIVTVTTRTPRPGEIHGVNYYFYSKEDFMKEYDDGNLLEKNNYLNNWYGVPLKPIEDAFKNGEVKTVVLDINGARALKEKYGDHNVYVIFVGANNSSIVRRFLKERKWIDKSEVEDRLEFDERTSSEYMNFSNLIIWNNDDDKFENIVQVIKNKIYAFISEY